MANDPSCIFCRIILGELPASVVTEDDNIVAFMDINPATRGHLLVVPREHHARIATIPGTIMSHMALIGQWLAAALRASPIKTEGINLFLADGAAAGQDVMHAHLHIIPRWNGDGVHIGASYGEPPSREELDHLATTIRNAAID